MPLFAPLLSMFWPSFPFDRIPVARLSRVLMLLSSLALGACSTDINVNAPWKEETIVTGLIDPNDTVHYLRIHKAFLDPNRNALVVAQIRDSLYHDVLRTFVWIEVWKNGVRQDSLPCSPFDTVIQGGAGIFPIRYACTDSNPLRRTASLNWTAALNIAFKF